MDCRRGKQLFGAGSAAGMASGSRDVSMEHGSIPQRLIQTGGKNPDSKQTS